MTRSPQRRRKKFINFYEHAVERLIATGITAEQIESLRDFGLMARCNVTGFHEGRSGAGRFTTLLMAIQHVKETGEEAYYVEMDLKNLSGLNAVLGASGANVIFGRIAALVRRELSAVASETCFFRHGGDEMSAFLVNAKECDIREAFARIHREIAALADDHDLVAIPHPKHVGDDRFSGLGIYFGFCQIQPCHEDDPAAVFSAADHIVEERKMRAVG